MPRRTWWAGGRRPAADDEDDQVELTSARAWDDNRESAAVEIGDNTEQHAERGGRVGDDDDSSSVQTEGTWLHGERQVLDRSERDDEFAAGLYHILRTNFDRMSFHFVSISQHFRCLLHKLGFTLKFACSNIYCVLHHTMQREHSLAQTGKYALGD